MPAAQAQLAHGLAVAEAEPGVPDDRFEVRVAVGHDDMVDVRGRDIAEGCGGIARRQQIECGVLADPVERQPEKGHAVLPRIAMR